MYMDGWMRRTLQCIPGTSLVFCFVAIKSVEKHLIHLATRMPSCRSSSDGRTWSASIHTYEGENCYRQSIRLNRIESSCKEERKVAQDKDACFFSQWFYGMCHVNVRRSTLRKLLLFRDRSGTHSAEQAEFYRGSINDCRGYESDENLSIQWKSQGPTQLRVGVCLEQRFSIRPTTFGFAWAQSEKMVRSETRVGCMQGRRNSSFLIRRSG
jgi:hypothetical protein